MTSPNLIEITFQLTQREIYQANVAIVLRRYRRLIGVLVILAAVTCALFVAAIGFGATALQDFTPATVILTILAPVFFVILLLVNAHTAAAQLSRKNPSLQGSTLWTFSNAGVSTSGPAARTNLLWSTYAQARETRTLFLLFPQRHLANVIPKRAFAGKNELADFRALLADNGLDLHGAATTASSP